MDLKAGLIFIYVFTAISAGYVYGGEDLLINTKTETPVVTDKVVADNNGEQKNSSVSRAPIATVQDSKNAEQTPPPLKQSTAKQFTVKQATAKQAPPNLSSPKKGDTIWLEEKIAPSTRWIENLVKPLGIWMEKKIQPRYVADDKENSGTQPEVELVPLPPSGGQEGPIITPEQAAVVSKQYVQGEVLRIKLLESAHSVSRYRVKLISTAGEIHILYINAHTGVLIQPAPPPNSE
jgi:hypothetical protein